MWRPSLLELALVDCCSGSAGHSTCPLELEVMARSLGCTSPVLHRTRRRHRAPRPPSDPQLLHAAHSSSPTAFVPAVRWRGQTDIGAWHAGMPAPGTPVASVRQSLTLLINRGTVAPNVDCVSCWGATLGGVSDPARSAADALLGARVVRAVELDINPEWVAGYLYAHRRGVGPLPPVPLVPGQPGVPGFFLSAYSRDFFTIEAR